MSLSFAGSVTCTAFYSSWSLFHSSGDLASQSRQKKCDFVTENVCKRASPLPNDYMIESLYLSSKVIISAASTLYFYIINELLLLFVALASAHWLQLNAACCEWFTVDSDVLIEECRASCIRFKRMCLEIKCRDKNKNRNINNITGGDNTPSDDKAKLSPLYKCRSARARDENNSFFHRECSFSRQYLLAINSAIMNMIPFRNERTTKWELSGKTATASE